MTRDPQIPLALWISAAIVAHLMGGEGAVEVARVYEDRASFRMLVQGARAGVRPGGTTFELVDIEAPAPPPHEPTDAPTSGAEPETADAPAEPDPNAEQKLAKADPAAKPPKPQAKPEPDKPEPDKPKPEPDKPKAEAVAVAPVVNAPAPPPPPMDHRIAVRQHAKPDQEDNPTANRIADDANHTDEETVARIRSHDQDEADPTPGAAHAGPKGEIGDSDETKIAQSEDKPGDPTHGPGESKPTSSSPEHSVPASPAPPAKVAAAPAGAGRGSASKPAQAMPPSPPSSPSPGGAGPAAPEVVSGERGGFTIDPANPGGDGQSRSPGRRRAPSYQNPVDVRSLGLGARGAPGGLNLNVDLAQVEAAVGDKQLRAERAADGESRKSKHRGSFDPGKFERWRAAIENYEPSVKLGNQTSLNAARVPFATYINSIHNRLHPIFAEEFLASLDNLPTSHQLNQDLVTHLEIVLSREEGRIVRMGVTRQSGSTAFDIVALNSVQRASPFGKAPEAIVSPDGNVYLHWEFHRDPFDACTTRNARPFLLKSAPQQPAVAPMPKRLKGRSSDERRDLPPPLVPMR